jgi:hypothetical protein
MVKEAYPVPFSLSHARGIFGRPALKPNLIAAIVQTQETPRRRITFCGEPLQNGQFAGRLFTTS